MSNVKVVLDGSSAKWRSVFRGSSEIREALQKHVDEAARVNSAELSQVAHAPFKPQHAYGGKVVVADNTMLGKVKALSKGAYIAGSAHGLPKW